MPRIKQPQYDLKVFRNGTVRASIKAYEKESGKLKYEDEENLATAAGRTKAIKRMGDKLKLPKAKLREYEETLEQKWHEARDEEERAKQESNETSTTHPEQDNAPYFVEHGRIWRRRFNQNGEVYKEVLCNFVAKIDAETTYDDGSGETQHCFCISGSLADGGQLAAVDVPAADFATMNWPIKHWGVRAIVSPGQGAKDHLRAAIQEMSRDAERRTVYRQTGWRQIGGQWLYLHSAGAVGTNGTVTAHNIDLPGNLTLIALPDPPEGDNLAIAVRASLRVLDLARERITAPVLGAVYRAPFGSVDFAGHIVGPSGCFKTELAALAQQHYGPGLDSRHLPGSWTSTANALETLAFTAADTLIVVDDFAPGGSQADVARFHRDADRVIRSAGNRSARMRLRSDGELRPPRPPRCLLLSTGEETPKGHSVRGRLGIIEVSGGDIDAARLTACQTGAHNVLYAAAMAAFLRWIAARHEQLRDSRKEEIDRLREEYRAKDTHARTGGIVADLAYGWKLFLQFAVESGAITETEARDYAERARAGLLAMAQHQADHQQAAEPAAHFMRLGRAALASGRAHIASLTGVTPAESPEAWGWRKEDTHEGPTWKPQGRRIGWIEGEAVYIDPEAAHAEAQRLAVEQNDSLAVSCQTLGKRLQERRFLSCSDQERERLTVRKVCQGVRRAVWQMHIQSFLGGL
jgi:hypothetical protein